MPSKEYLQNLRDNYPDKYAELLEREKLRKRVRRKNNPEHFRIVRKLWRDSNLDTINHKRRERRKNPIVKSREKELRNPLLSLKITSHFREKSLGISSIITVKDLIDIKKKFNHKCFNCGSTKRLIFDHFYPVRYKIPLSKDNCVLLCHKCNCGGKDKKAKNSKHPKEFFTKEQIKDLKENYGIKIRRKL